MMGAYTYTLVQPPLPLDAVTPLERLVLSEIMQTRARDRHLHLCAYDDLATEIDILLYDAVRALRASRGRNSLLNAVVDRLIARAGRDADSLTIDLRRSDLSLEHILQDIVRRSPNLTHLVVTSGHAGGRAGAADLSVSVITTWDIRQKDAGDMVRDCLREPAMASVTLQ